MKKAVLFLSILALLSWNGFQKEDDNSYITIIFKNPNIKDTIFYSKSQFTIDDKQIFYRFENSFIDNRIPVSNKEVTVRIKTSKPIYLYHKYYVKDRYYNSYCFYPNDTLIFLYQGEVPYVKSKKRQTYNYDYGSIFNLKNQTDTDELLFWEKYKRNKNEQELLTDKLAKEQRELKQIVFWDTLKANKKVDENNYDLNISYLKNMRKLKTSNPLETLNQSCNLADISYAYFVKAAFEKIYRPKMKTTSNGKMPDYNTQFDNVLILNKINLSNRDYLLFDYLENIAKMDSKANFMKRYVVFEKITKDTILKNYFKKNYPLLFEVNKNDNEVLLWDASKGKKPLNELISSYKDKVVYVDFWASWCMPCRAAMPASRQLHEKYINKDIVFIYISIDANFENWRKATDKEKLSGMKDNFVAINYPNASLYKELTLSTIPRYLLYDKKGVLVNSTAPYPGSEEIEKEFDRLLRE